MVEKDFETHFGMDESRCEWKVEFSTEFTDNFKK